MVKLKAEFGFTFEPAQIIIEARENRWLARLPGDLLAWFPANELGARRLENERLVLRLVSETCSFRVPRMLAIAPDGSVDVREPVPGSVDPFRVYRRAVKDVKFCRVLGKQIGGILAQQHSAAIARTLAGKLPSVPYWPLPSDAVLRDLQENGLTPEFIRECEVALRRYEKVMRDCTEEVLVHGDIGFHNFAMDLETGTIVGVFDYDSAVLADPHLDFRYLVFDVERYELLQSACEVYSSLTGRTIVGERVLLYNAACAIAYLAARNGVPPDEKFAGRTLEEDLRWVRHALSLVN